MPAAAAAAAARITSAAASSFALRPRSFAPPVRRLGEAALECASGPLAGRIRETLACVDAAMMPL